MFVLQSNTHTYYKNERKKRGGEKKTQNRTGPQAIYVESLRGVYRGSRSTACDAR